MTYNTSPFRLIGLFLLSILAISSWTTVTALPTTHEVVALASSSAVRTSTIQEVAAPVDDASDDSLSMQSYTEKMATGLFGRIPGLEGQSVRHPAASHTVPAVQSSNAVLTMPLSLYIALRRSMVPTPSPTGSYIYEFYGCFGQGCKPYHVSSPPSFLFYV